MKNVFFFLTIFLTMLFASSAVYADYSPYILTDTAVRDENNADLSDFSSCQSARFVATVKKNSVTFKQNAQIICALYRGDTLLDSKLYSAETFTVHTIVLPSDRAGLSFKAFVWPLDANGLQPLCPPYEFPTRTPPVLEVGSLVATDLASLKSAIATLEAQNGGTVYIKASRLDCDQQIWLSKKPTNPVKICAYPGYTPVLDFSTLKATQDAGVGVRITGRNYQVQGLIIQKAPYNGLLIRGVGAGGSVVSDCIFRYNYFSGLQITTSADHNIIKNCYAYRNFDLANTKAGMGGAADGFALKQSANVEVPTDPKNVGFGNQLINCFAWENSDDGYDSFDLHEDVYYENCMTWHNGDPNVFTGQYDFARGKKIDQNLDLFTLFMTDPTFVQNLNNNKFQIPMDIVVPQRNETYAVALAGWHGNQNGFKIGSASVTNISARTMKNCIAFDHQNKGFDQNGGSADLKINNALSFNNTMNYSLDKVKITSFSKVYSFNGTNMTPSNYKPTAVPTASQKAYTDEVNSIVAYIENCVASDRIPHGIWFSFWDL